MSAATTIAPALNPLRAPDPTLPPSIEPDPRAGARRDRGRARSIVEPQHMQALARANEVRLARAALKRQVAAGSRDVIEVVLDVPWEAESMTISELLSPSAAGAGRAPAS